MNTNVSTAPSVAPMRTLKINHKPLWVALALLGAGAFYLEQTVSWRQSALWIIGALLGVTLYYASFGFTQAWRVFVSDRRGAGLRAQMLMLGIGVVLFFPFLAQGELFGQAVAGNISPPGVSVLLGAFIFGVGMQLGGGCASGTLFAVGGGNTRMLVTLTFFIVGSVIATAHADWWTNLYTFAAPTSLVKTWGLSTALIANLLVFALIAWGATVLEKRRHGEVISFASRTDRPASLLRGPWSLIWGGIALVVLNFATLALSGRPWGVTGAFALTGAKIMNALGSDIATWSYWVKQQKSLNAPLINDVTTIMAVGLTIGALAAASASGKFAPIWKVSARSLLGAVVGGLLLGYGARMAYGCNIGAYFSGILSGSLHAWLWLPAAFAGSAIGVYLRPLFGLEVEKTLSASSC